MPGSSSLTAPGNRLVVLDTSILVDVVRTGRHEKRIDTVDGLQPISSVVFAEWLRGTKHPREQSFLSALAGNDPILTPTETNWIESGEILAKMRINHGYTVEKLRDPHSDVSIALTARSHGAIPITSNRADFELIREYRSFRLEVW